MQIQYINNSNTLCKNSKYSYSNCKHYGNNFSNQVNFKGYDARPMSGIFVRDFIGSEPFYSMLSELTAILNKENVDVFVQGANGIAKNNFKDSKPAICWPFVQDFITFYRNKTFSHRKNFGQIDNTNEIDKFFNITLTNDDIHVEGGNYFFIRDNHKEFVLIGKNEFKLMNSLKKIQEFFGKRNICSVFQPDYHLDLSLRPLNNRKILVNDPDMLTSAVIEAIKKGKSLLGKDNDPQLRIVIENLEKLYEDIKLSNAQHDTKDKYKKLRQDLKAYKFNIIRVPASLIEADDKTMPVCKFKNSIEENLFHDNKYRFNFINAFVHERQDKSMVYITNKSDIDEKLGITPEIAKKLNFSFEKIFVDSLKGHISPEDIHFVGGQDDFMQNFLYKHDAGLHCLISEIPVMK